MHWLRFAVLVLIITILQMSLVDVIAVTDYSVKPDLLLVLMVFFAVYADPAEAVITSFTIGFAADIIGSSMGPQIISFGLFGTLLSDLHRTITLSKMFYKGIAIFAAGFLTTALAYLLTFLKAERIEFGIYTHLFWVPLYSAIVGTFLFLPFAWWMRIKKRKV